MRFSNRLGIATAVLASGAIAGSGIALAGTASAASARTASAGTAAASTTTASAVGQASFGFTTLNNAADHTFNQLLGINDRGAIAGYFGSGAQGHPNRGYGLSNGAYTNENFPNSVQTQVTGLNGRGVTVGFWSTMNNASQVNDNFGFYAANGQFHNVNFPTGDNATPPMNQLLGVNDSGVAVGFYTDAAGSNHGYRFSIGTGQFSLVQVPGATSSTAAGINDRGDVAGFYTNADGAVQGFLSTAAGRVTTLAFPGATATSALGVNLTDEVVGVYSTGSGSSAASHGFTWTAQGGFTTVDDPNGVGTTTINGVNDAGDLVGFYVDGNGNTDGLLAKPTRAVAFSAMRTRSYFVPLAPMPAGTVTLGHDGMGNLTASVQAFGLTPGSAHDIALTDRSGALIASLTPLTATGTGQLSGTATSTYTGQIPAGSHLVITQDTTAGSPVIGTTHSVYGTATYRLHAVEAGFGTPQGFATVTYSPAAKTITVRVNASGFSPGAHAAHIHIGSCQSQGGVVYMLMDLTANARGQIVNEVRTVTGVTGPIPSGTWYLNVHQGDSNQILANGQPTSLFRPLTCGQIAGSPSGQG